MDDPRIVHVPADSVRPDDLIDLDGNPYAAGSEFAASFPYEYARVDDVERETADCVRIDTDAGSYGFPPSYPIPVIRAPKVG